jgi:hypothetical protein
MRITGGIKPFSQQKVRLGQTSGVKIDWDNPTGTLGSVNAGDAFNFNFSARSSDNNVVRFYLKSGSLPDGMTLSENGTLSGTSNSPGMYAFVIKAVAGLFSVERTFSVLTKAITVAWTSPATLGTIPASISTLTTLSATASDGGAVDYQLVSGSPPSGMEFVTSGAVLGKPSTGGTAAFTVRATRKANIFTDRTFTLAVAAPMITWTTGSLPMTTGGNVYDQTVVATSNQTNAVLSYSVVYGSLPAGLSLNSATGRITGAASNVGGSSVFRIRANDGYTYLDKEFTITVNEDIISWNTPSGSFASLNGGQTFMGTLASVSNITGRLVNQYRVVSGALPAGLTLDPVSGSISGTAQNVNGLSSFIVRASDGFGFADRSFQITVLADVITWQTPTQVTFNAGDGDTSIQLNATALSGSPITYTVVSGTVPTGFSFNPTTAIIRGSSSTTVTSAITIRASNSITSSERTFTVSVNGAPVWSTVSGSIGSVLPGQQISFSLIASDPDGIQSYTVIPEGSLAETVSIRKMGNTGYLTGTFPTPSDQFPPTWTTDRAIPTVNEGVIQPISLAAAPSSGRTISRYLTVGGTLPWGLAMAANGVVSGSAFNQIDEPFTPLAPAPLFATATDLGTKSEGDSVSLTMNATSVAGSSISNYSFVSGTMPWGIVLNGSTGVLSGTIGDIEPVSENVAAGPAPRWMTSNAVSLAVLNENDPVSGVKFEALSNSASGIRGYVLQSGALPWGLTLSANTGDVSGNLVFDLMDTPFVSAPGPTFITASDMGTASEGTPLSATIKATPVTGNAVTSYALVGGILPWGITVNLNGVISGTIDNIEPISDAPANLLPPTWMTNASLLYSGDENSTFTMNVSATPSSNRTVVSYNIANGAIPWGVTLNNLGTLSGTISNIEPVRDPVVIPEGPIWQTSNATVLFAGDEIMSFNATVVANSATNTGIAAYTITKGGAPWGVSLNSKTGQFTGNVTLIEQDDPFVVTNTPVFVTPAGSLGTVDEGTVMTTPIIVTPGPRSAPVSGYSVVAGAIPWGLTLSQTGVLSGTIDNIEPIVEMTANLNPPVWQTNAATLYSGDELSSFSTTVMANAATNKTVVSYTVMNGTIPWGTTLNSAGVLTGTIWGIEPVSDPVAIPAAPVWITANTSVLFSGDEIMPFTATVVANSATNTGIAAYMIANGTVPWGVTLNSKTGQFTGNVTLIERDDPFIVTTPPVFTTPGDLGTVNEGALISQSIVALPGAASIPVATYAVSGGAMPWGITLSPSGTLSGTIDNIEPVSEGIVLGTPPSFTTPAGSLGTFSNSATVSTSVSATLAGSSISYGVQSGTLPWGVVLNQTNGSISGSLNPTDDSNRTFAFSIRAFSSNAGYIDRAFSITVQ